MVHQDRLVQMRSRGFSLPELLVVMGIMGLIMLVSVPNFINFYHSNKVKTSMREFTINLRAARQRAVTRNSITRVTFDTGVGKTRYRVLESLDGGATWNPTPLMDRNLEEPVYFQDTGFEDTEPATPDTFPDIVFRNNGAVEGHPGGTDDYVVIRTIRDIPRNQYTIRISAAGAVKSE